MTDVVLTWLTVFVDAVYRAHPVADICIAVAATLGRVVFTGAGFWGTEESAHWVRALLITIWTL